jgi:peptide/nickel transport system substrate-binding protein
MKHLAWLLGAVALAASMCATGADQPKSGGLLKFAVGAEPPNYDCHAQTSFRVHPPGAPALQHAPQVRYREVPGDQGRPRPSRGRSPRTGSTYTFKLKKGVKFHDGSTFSSEDIKATYERLRNPAKGVLSIRQASYADIASIETPDPLTVVFKLKKTNASMLTNFASPWDCVYSAAKLKQDPKFPERNVMGTGPFTFVEHVAGSHWSGRKFDGYFEKGKPYLNGYYAIFVAGAPMVNALAAGEVLAEFRGHSPADRDRLVKALGAKATVQESPWVCSLVVTFNTKKKPFDDVRVRQALSLAVDRWGGAQALSKIALVRHVGGILRPGYELAANEKELAAYPGFSKDINASRTEAKKLLQAAGVPNLTFALTNRNVAMPYTPGRRVPDRPVAADRGQRQARATRDAALPGGAAARQPGFRRGARLQLRFHGRAEPAAAEIPVARPVHHQLRAADRPRARRPLRQAIGRARQEEALRPAARVREARARTGLYHPDDLVAPHHRLPQADEGLVHHAQPLRGAGSGRGLARSVIEPTASQILRLR